MTRIKLEVERDPTAGEYVNRIANPSGTLGAWGWLSTTGGSRINYALYGGNPALQYITVGGTTNLFVSAMFKVTGGEQLRAQWDLVDAPVAGYVVQFWWFDINGVGHSTTPSAPQDNITIPSTNYWTAARTVPAGAVFGALTFQVTKADFTHPYPSTGSAFAVRNVRVFSSQSGSLSDASMLANAAAPNVLWTNVLSSTYNAIQVRREEFDLGTLTATIRNSALDPSTTATLRPGRKVRLTALNGATSGTFEPIFTGTVQTADVSYDVPRRKPTDPLHCKIELTAVDAMQALSAIQRRYSVDAVNLLPWVLEGSGITDAMPVPWDCDEIAGHVATATYRAINDNASAADQVALTRDSVSGYAWIDRLGVLRVRSTLAGTAVTIDESMYSSVDLSFDVGRVINSLAIKLLNWSYTDNQMQEDLTETRVSVNSITTWGRRHRDFTMLATTFLNRGGLNTIAAAVFAANATPKITPNSVVLPIRTDAHRVARAFVDLYDLHRVKNTAKAVDENQRVTSIAHDITPEGWLVTVGYSRSATIPIPQQQPAVAVVSA
ncbi:hypothetical protein EUA93_18860 [Nocardioides oleivorans]|uniref:Uncharacterized protein n=2 Tax=Nocardioides oleivorans TaxID=273676 RepID=A0A4Q2RQ51_9ACTN|nr:hypothetical protein EUA93_18860 [Nocardioides oleivorans]